VPANSRLVYSSAGNNLCSACGKTLHKCRCADKARAKPPSDGIVRLALETKGRKGKGVTLVTGFDLPVEELKLMAKRLKAICGSGGTVKGGVIEIQGDHRALLKTTLEPLHTVKLSGG
jgi:translation initiation factor 1